jgi:hypothetical protein
MANSPQFNLHQKMSGIVYLQTAPTTTTTKIQIFAHNLIVDPQDLKNSLVCSFFNVDFENDFTFLIR